MARQRAATQSTFERQRESSQAQQLAAVQSLHSRYLEERSHLESQMAAGAGQILQEASQAIVQAQAHSVGVNSQAENFVAFAEEAIEQATVSRQPEAGRWSHM